MCHKWRVSFFRLSRFSFQMSLSRLFCSVFQQLRDTWNIRKLSSSFSLILWFNSFEGFRLSIYKGTNIFANMQIYQRIKRLKIPNIILRLQCAYSLVVSAISWNLSDLISVCGSGYPYYVCRDIEQP